MIRVTILYARIDTSVLDFAFAGSIIDDRFEIMINSIGVVLYNYAIAVCAVTGRGKPFLFLHKRRWRRRDSRVFKSRPQMTVKRNSRYNFNRFGVIVVTAWTTCKLLSRHKMYTIIPGIIVFELYIVQITLVTIIT